MTKAKRNRLYAWIRDNKESLQKDHGITAIRGVVIAPNAKVVKLAVRGGLIDNDPNFSVITECGLDGVKHLGGLAQIYKWLDETQ